MKITRCKLCKQQRHETSHHCPAGIAWPGPYASHDFEVVEVLTLEELRERLESDDASHRAWAAIEQLDGVPSVDQSVLAYAIRAAAAPIFEEYGDG